MRQDKRPLKKSTHPQTANGRFLWQVEYGCDHLRPVHVITKIKNREIYYKVTATIRGSYLLHTDEHTVFTHK